MNWEDIKPGQTIRLTKTIEGVVNAVIGSSIELKGEGSFTHDYRWVPELVKDVPIEEGWCLAESSNVEALPVYRHADGMVSMNPSAPKYDFATYFGAEGVTFKRMVLA